MSKKIIQVVGARPNFMKIAPLHRAFKASSEIDAKIVHTGQHYDERMSDIFFNQLELPKPDYFLGIGGGTHTQQKAKIMLAFEEVLDQEQPDLVLVVGDVNSTIACALVAVKKGIKIAHVEAGLRSGDRTMPEEINRILTDSISDYLFVTEQSGMINLAKEGVEDSKIFFVGNVMIDSLVFFKEKNKGINLVERFGPLTKDYILVTMHRPSNVDNVQGLSHIIKILKYAAQYKNIVFPIHPRTLKNLEKFDLLGELKAITNLKILGPQGYLEFLKLMEEAVLVLTDSGGIQEETTYLQVPCLTFRASTERPVTVSLGTNQLLEELDPEITHDKITEILNGKIKKGVIPPLWDGESATRIVEVLESVLCN